MQKVAGGVVIETGNEDAIPSEKGQNL